MYAWALETLRQRPGLVRGPVDHFACVLELGGGVGLAACADGVGTKLLVAQGLGRLDTVGIDLVAMNVNDLVCVGATPLAVLDYLAVERDDPEVIAEIGRGLAEGARQAGVVIPGGETAVVPELLRGARVGSGFDVAGVALGTVAVERACFGQDVRAGDVLVGLASSGIHANGLTVARRVLGDWEAPLPGDPSQTVGEALLAPTRIYAGVAGAVWASGVEVSAMAHVTGGGWANLRRIEARCGYTLTEVPEAPAVFQAIAEAGGLSRRELYGAFNMGVGFSITCRPEGVDEVLGICAAHGVSAWVLGRAVDDPERTLNLPTLGLKADDRGFQET